MSARSSFLPCITAALALIASGRSSAVPPGQVTPRIAVDQFGYTSGMTKIAVLSDPQTGFNEGEAYIPAATMEVRAWGSHTVVFSGTPTAWNGGAVHGQSGDKVWWFDFSAIAKWGEYYVYDPVADRRSHRFRIHHDVYDEPLKHAARVFFYQRRGLSKQPPYADPKWADGPSHLGPLQDSHCRLVSAPGDATLEKDLRGGWFDAGDFNKYTNFAAGTLSDLLFAFEQQPLAWRDDSGIPESGNGLPDLLDEIKWELDWLLRMQNGDGSLLSKVAVNGFQSASPPSADTNQIFYGAASTMATLTGASAFAHASRVFQAAGQSTYAGTLRNAAIAAWNWAVANPSVVFGNAGFASANPEGDSYARAMTKLGAAVYLYALTGEGVYRTYVEAEYQTAHPVQWAYWYAFEPTVQDALLFYSALPGAAAPVVNTIRSAKQSSIQKSEFLPEYTGRTDAYRAYLKDGDYTWGSNSNKCHVGIIFHQQLAYGLDPANAANYRSAAAGYLHGMHGVNPLTLVQLTNMYAFGAESCANEIYHGWFTDGSVWDHALNSPKGPPPGYVTGGPNPSWHPDGSYSGPPIIPPAGQPVQKSYKDWNTSWPENSWELTEPAIYYQAAYLRLLASCTGPLTLADWTLGQGLSGASAAPGADGNQNGRTNLEEFALPAPGLVAKVETHSVDGQNHEYLTVTFPRRFGPELTYEVQVSPNLQNWTTVCVVAGTLPPAGAGFLSQSGTGYLRTVKARDVVQLGAGEQKRFLRIEVTTP